MISCALGFGFAALGIALAMNLWRLLKGPGPEDRILALDTMVINVIGLIVLAGIASGDGTSFGAALLVDVQAWLFSSSEDTAIARVELP
ncbi:MAG: monovalent cation/H+ antiporter complex subunit F, partial [Erythrobacteraceae bacterium]